MEMGHNGEAHINHRDGTEVIEDDVNGDEDANDNLDVKSIRFLFPESRDDTSPVGIGTTKTRGSGRFVFHDRPFHHYWDNAHHVTLSHQFVDRHP